MDNKPDQKEETYDERIARIMRETDEMDEVDKRYAKPPQKTEAQEIKTEKPKPTPKTKLRFVLLLNEIQKAQLTELSQELGLTLSAIMRNAIMDYYDKNAEAGYVKIAKSKEKQKNKTPEELCADQGGEITIFEGRNYCGLIKLPNGSFGRYIPL